MPILTQAMRSIVRRSGLLGRKDDGKLKPGMFWRGLQDVLIFLEGVRHVP